ncbi:MAG: hypothetical protein IJU72_03570 [Bacteroidales bacterium]|nr:hypothetical protein [Bacteroidales bacterium]
MQRTNTAIKIALALLIALGAQCHRAESPLGTTSLQPQGTGDTVVYSVYLAPNQASPSQQVECLLGLNHNAFVDLIFGRIYNGQCRAYGFDDARVLSVSDVRRMERSENFSRERITLVQFRELWSTDSLGRLHKQVLSLTLGIEAYSPQGTFLGHRALFRVDNR